MSGRIHRELITARAGCLKHLSRSEYIFLETVANRCDEETRQGWCATEEIRWAIGSRKPGGPAGEKTVREMRKRLVEKGFLTVVRRGFGTHGKTYATTYALPVFEALEPASPVGRFTEDNLNRPNEDLNRPSEDLNRPSEALEPADMDCHPTSLTTSITNVHNNARLARDTRPPPERDYRVFNPDRIQEPPKFCDAHPGGTKKSCVDCKLARQRNALWWREAKDWDAMNESQIAAEAARGRPPCATPGCDNPASAQGDDYCDGCYERRTRHE